MHFLKWLAPGLFIFSILKAHAEKVPLNPWYHKTLDLETAWKYTLGNSNGLIALIDSGIDYKQTFLEEGVWQNLKEKIGNNRDNDKNGFKNDVIGWNFDLDNNKPMDASGHGTWLASFMIARPGKNHPTGICPGCEIMPLRIFDEDGYTKDDDVLVDAIYYAIDNGAKIINLATASEGADSELKKALIEAGKHDILVLAAASNDAENLDNADTYPARYQFPFMVTVAATRQNGNLTSNSNWGKKTVHFGAPGIDLVAYWRFAEDGDQPGWFVDGEGTSDAVAMASAVAGLIRSKNPRLKATEVKQIMINTVTPSGYLKNKTITGGVINAGAALKCAADLKCLK
ncbi:MAG: S8 family serine peptidase [Xanthomonadaceae bacterium]|nr:S8 family serine peptidase [Xanthomonadaceae bacterium]